MLIVFDLDGTLIDSARDLADSVNALIEEYGGRPLAEDDVVRMVGEGAAVLVRRALGAAGLTEFPPDALPRFLAQYNRRLTNHTRPYEGVREALAALRGAGHTLAVLTNKPQAATTTILERLDLAASFIDVVGGDTEAGRKPDPAGLRSIVERAGSTPERTIMVGDSPVDHQTARRAGTRVCLTRYGFGFRFPDTSVFTGDELFVDRASELPDVIARVAAAHP